jgi:hypothetical protein
MSNDWRNTPCGNRPRRLPLFPHGLVYFGVWRTLRWFLLLVMPLLTSAGAAYIRGRGLATAVGILLLGVGVAVGLFVDLCSGMSSSNCGTFYRGQEPAEFWLAVVFCGLFYLVLVFVGYTV